MPGNLFEEPAHVYRLQKLIEAQGKDRVVNVRSRATLYQTIERLLRHELVVVSDTIRSPGYPAIEPAMTGRENLELVARLFGCTRGETKARAAAVLEQLGLVEAGDRLARTYSGGVRRRLDLGASLVGTPKLLLLDEPTTGRDPRSRAELWDAIRAMVAGGTDVLLTTQYLDEADHLASQIVIIDQGRAVATGSPQELKRKIGGDIVEIHVRNGHDLPAVAGLLERLEAGTATIDEATHRVSMRVGSGSDGLIQALHSVTASQVELEDISLRKPNLDEVFLTLTGSPVPEADARPRPPAQAA